MAADPVWELSIDFGTSNTTAAARFDGRVRTVTFNQGASSMPSAVLVDGNEIRVGTAAQQWRLAPDGFEPNPKQRIGEATVFLSDREVPVVDLVAAVLREVRQRATEVAGRRTLGRLVMTHPEGWPVSKLDVLREAARRAGFDAPVDLVKEPIAAVRRYEAERPDAEGGHSIVVDFGGGTCDVAILGPTERAGEPRGIVTTVGDQTLGGTDFDYRVLSWVYRTLQDRGFGDVVERLRSRAGVDGRLTLLADIRTARESLSDYQSAVIPISGVTGERSLRITRDEYEVLIADDVAGLVSLVRTAMRNAGLEKGQLRSVYLTGGSSQTPSVVRAVEGVTGVRPAPFDNPKLVVAEGALLTLPAPVERAEPEPRKPPLVPDRRVPGPEPYQVGPVERTEQRRRRTAPLVIAIAGVALALVVVLIVLLVNLRPPTPSETEAADTVTTPAAGDITPVSSPAVTESLTPPDTCWDGSTRVVGNACPKLTGLAAAMWVFDLQDSPDCKKSTDKSANAKATWECTWDDLNDTTARLYEFDDFATGQDTFNNTLQATYPGTPKDWTLDSGDVVGLEWHGRNGAADNIDGKSAKWDDDAHLYRTVPFAIWVYTDKSTGGTDAEQDLADNTRMNPRTEPVVKQGFATD